MSSLCIFLLRDVSGLVFQSLCFVFENIIGKLPICPLFLHYANEGSPSMLIWFCHHYSSNIDFVCKAWIDILINSQSLAIVILRHFVISIKSNFTMAWRIHALKFDIFALPNLYMLWIKFCRRALFSLMVLDQHMFLSLLVLCLSFIFLS